MATQLTIPFGGDNGQTLNTTSAALFVTGTQIQADPVNNALRSSSLVTAILAESLFTSDILSKTTNASKSEVAGTFKHLDIHVITLRITFTSQIATGCYVCAVIPTINHQIAFNSTTEIKAYFDNTTRTFPASGYFINNTNGTNAYAATLEVSSSQIAVVGVYTNSTNPSMTSLEISGATVATDSVISIY